MHFPGLAQLMGLFVLLMAGFIMINLLGALSFLIPAFIFAILVWFVTGSPTLVGVAFLALVLLSLLRRLG